MAKTARLKYIEDGIVYTAIPQSNGTFKLFAPWETINEMRISKEEKEIDKIVKDYIEDISKPTSTNFHNENTMPEHLNRLITWINKELEKEHNETHLSNSDFTRSLAYCFGLSKVKAGIENILAGREFDEY